MSERPSDKDLARMLRNGASGIGASHSEYCVSSDNCACGAEQNEMLAAAELLDPDQRAADEAIVSSVRGFPIFDSKEEFERYTAALQRLAESPEGGD